MAVTLKHLAKALDLSVSTVNAALHNRSDISLTTRKRVQDMVRQMNYRPNLVARSLVTRKSNVIGVIVPDLSRFFFTEVVKGIDAVASGAGYNLLLCNTGEGTAREDEQVATLMAKQIDGLILASAYPPRSDRPRKQLWEWKIPIVLIDRFFSGFHFVGGDDVRIGSIATKHLIDQGYTRIAHLRGPNISTALGRLEGYTRTLRAHRLRVRRDYVVEAPYHAESGGYDAMRKLLNVDPRPDAVFAASDPIAIGALDALWQMNIRIPEEFGVVGVGNHRYDAYLRVPLTTVDQNRLEIGKRATLLLLKLIQGPPINNARPVLVEPELIVRESSARLASTEALEAGDGSRTTNYRRLRSARAHSRGQIADPSWSIP